VVVPTYRRDDLLTRCLEKLIDQDLPDEDFEVIVVDDAAGETVAALVSDMAGHSRVRLIALAGRQAGPAAARNIGWRKARGDIIAFMDDDAYPERRDWLKEGLRPFSDPSVAAVTGQVEVPADDPPTDFQLNVKNLETGTFLTCNAFCRRSVLEELGGFDERFRVAFREDSDLAFRIEQAGGRIVRNPDAVVIHPAPRGPFAVSLRLQRYSLFNALLRKKHPRRYRELEVMPPLNYYAIVLLPPLAAGLGLAGHGLAALTAGGICAGLYVEFLLRRIRRSSKRPGHLLEMAFTSLLIPPLSVYWRLRGAWQFRVLFI
jgi:glycosyltransferase involved in cell wall biosynthesis